MQQATVLPPQPTRPEPVHNCPSCSHWLPEGTLACPDCQTLAYGQHLGQIAAAAQQLEQQQKWAEAREQWAAALAWLPGNTRQAEGIQQHIAGIDRKLQAEQDRKAAWTRRLGPFAPIAFFLLKLKSYLFIAFKLKFLFSIFAFFGIYWLAFGWHFALGFTASIFIHEMGHYVAVKRRGLKADLPMFFPGFGAYVRWYGMGVSREDLAGIALAGPFFGLLAALGCWWLYSVTHYAVWLVLANVGAWINLLNLVPVFGLDGAQATLALTRLQRGLIAATCGFFFVLTVKYHDLLHPDNHYIFLVIGGFMVWRCFRDDAPEETSTSPLVSFVALLLVLGLIVHMTGNTIAQLPEIYQQYRTH